MQGTQHKPGTWPQMYCWTLSLIAFRDSVPFLDASKMGSVPFLDASKMGTAFARLQKHLVWRKISLWAFINHDFFIFSQNWGLNVALDTKSKLNWLFGQFLLQNRKSRILRARKINPLKHLNWPSALFFFVYAAYWYWEHGSTTQVPIFYVRKSYFIFSWQMQVSKMGTHCPKWVHLR